MKKNQLSVKYYNKKYNAKAEGIEFKLTFEEFKKLSMDAGITWYQMNINGYHLARYNDAGAYKIGNCRFILGIENFKERKVSDKMRESSRRNIKAYNDSLTEDERKEHYRKTGIAVKNRVKKLTNEQRANLSAILSMKEDDVKKRHEILKGIEPGWGFLTRASKVIGIRPQVIGRFLKKYLMNNAG